MINVGIAGLGLIGGSLGASLRRARTKNGRFEYHVVGFSRDLSTVKEARRKGFIDTGSNRPSILVSCDIIVLAVPVQFTGAVVKKILPFIKKGAVLTDVGSVKSSVLKDIQSALRSRPDVAIVGSHPLAGSEKSGMAFSRADLFRNTVSVIVPHRGSRSSVNKIKDLWRSVGAHPILMTSQAHDRFLATTSHLPHVLAFALFSQTHRLARANAVVPKLIAGSFRDMTRIAASSPELWVGILKANRLEILKSWKNFEAIVRSLLQQKSSALQSTLTSLSAARRRWM